MKESIRNKEIKYGMTREDLAKVMLMNEHALRRFLKSIGIHHARKLIPREIELIKKEFGAEYLK
jgi:hypothetical protein